MSEKDFTPAVPLSSEAGRVGLVTCTRCGAAVLLSMVEDAMKIHDAWHAASEAAEPLATAPDPVDVGNARLCDDDGTVRRGPFWHGSDYPCTGYATVGTGVRLVCSNPIHQAGT